jgi:transposase
VKHSDIHNVARNHGVSDDVVWSMVEHVSKKMVINVKVIKRSGIDEIALRKGQQEFVTALVDLDRQSLVGLVKSRQQTDIEQTLAS